MLKGFSSYTTSDVLNNLNRGLGHADAYPFVLSPAAIGKLRFVEDVIGRAKAGDHPPRVSASHPPTPAV